MTTTKAPAKKTTPAKKATPRKAASARPDMVVDVTPTKDDVPLLGGPGAGMPHFADLDPALIASHPRNPRRSVHGLEEMADSIRAEGVLQRLVVAPTPAGMDPHPGVPYLALMGHRRLAASVLAEQATVPVEIRYDLDTLERQVAVMLVENIHRQDLTAVEEADAYQGLLDLGSLDEQGIAHATGRSLTTVRQRLRLAKAPSAAKEAVQAHKATLADVELLLESDGDPAQKDALKALVAGRDARYELQRAARTKTEREELREQVETARADRVAIVVLPEDWSYYPRPKAPQPMPLGTIVRGYDAWNVTPADIKKHAKCPGHALGDGTAKVWGPQAVWVCTTPSEHKDVIGSGGGLSDAEKAERAANRERNRQHKALQETHDVATEVRRRHLRTLIAGGGAPKALEVLAGFLAQAALVDTWAGQHEQLRARVRVLVDLLEHPLTEVAQVHLNDRYMGPHDAAGEMTKALAAAKPAVAITAAAAAVCEVQIAGRWTPTWPDRLDQLGRDWLIACRDDLGYQLTDYEQDLLGKATAAALAEVSS